MNALEYDKSRHYSISIIKTIQRVVGATVDGKWGPQTVEDVRVWQGHHDLTPDGKVGHETLQAILDAAGHNRGSDGDHDDGGHTHSDPPDVSGTIRHVGAWAGVHSLGHNAPRDVKFCQDHNINRLDVFVNGLPHDGRFHMHDADEIADLCSRAKDAGMEVHITSWIEPYASFIDEAADALIPLCGRVGASSLMWDAEEPWNHHQGVDYTEAARKVASAFQSLSCPMGVSGIMNTRVDRVGPLAQHCEYLVPQCYATSHNNLDPRTVATRGVDRWREKIANDKKFMVGLAAYRQSQVDGMGTRAAMVASLKDVASLGVDTISYWSLHAIKKSRVVAEVISEILHPR
jgi:hypothetical protein